MSILRRIDEGNHDPSKQTCMQIIELAVDTNSEPYLNKLLLIVKIDHTDPNQLSCIMIGQADSILSEKSNITFILSTKFSKYNKFEKSILQTKKKKTRLIYNELASM